ncbi:MAG TPA: type I-E CRISPR-associated protein Cse2/CasB [Gammaproteobacteria bacterium]|jgi:CRISPR system Cascade subunit CasB|nr:type I-E CRISPR-associated protein Cse2/CasB [Gammaproteobacteria bacterium]
MTDVVLRQDEREAIQVWYDWLCKDKQRGHRARLKRCTTVKEILLQPGFYRLCQPLPRLEERWLEGLAMVAGLLAMVKTPVDLNLPSVLGDGGDKPVFSELRFQKLLAARKPNDFFLAMRRAIVQAGEKSDPLSLADQVLHWYQQYRHPEWFTGQKQWQYRFAKPYYIQS